MAQERATPRIERAQRKQKLDRDDEEKIHEKRNPLGLEDRGGVMIQGVWTQGTDCSGDFFIVNVNLLFYLDCIPGAILGRN